MPPHRLHPYSKLILAAYGIFSVGLLLTCLFIIREVNGILETVDTLYLHPFSVSNAALEAKNTLATIRNDLLYGVLAQDLKKLQDAVDDIPDHDQQFAKFLDIVSSDYLGDTQDVAQVRRVFAQWVPTRSAIIAAAKGGDFDLARRMILDSGTPAYESINQALAVIIEFARNKASALRGQVREQSAQVNRLLYATIFTGFFASFVCGLFVVRHVQRVVSRNEELLRHQATHDPLTRLPNRPLFRDRLALALNVARREKSMVGVLYLDLDRFKAINDILGHEAGDDLLALVADRISHTLRRSDTVARLGGDEFVVLIPDAKDLEEIRRVADKVAVAVNQPALLKGNTVPVRASLGLAAFPGDGDEVDALIASADAAMYRDKPACAHAPADAHRLETTQ